MSQASSLIDTRREAIAALVYSTTFSLMSACSREPSPSSTTASRNSEADARALLDEIGNSLLRLVPETATSLGIDSGARAELRSQLMDRSADGQQRIAGQLRRDLERANALDASRLPHATRTSIEVVRSAYATALEGFAMPYGDVPVGGWRITPYVVIQNVGAYLDVPRFLDAEHRIEQAADAEAYLARLQSYAQQVDGELGRSQAARAKGLVPPAFLLDKALAQLSLSIKNAREGGTLVESIERRTKKYIPGTWAERARGIAAKEVAPALGAATGGTAGAARDRDRRRRDVGPAARRGVLPVGAEGLDDDLDVARRDPRDGAGASCNELHARMDEILKSVGYTQGSVGSRMQALAKDPRYRFAEGDRGRAEITAFIQNRLDWIRAQMPRAFNTVVNPNMEVKRLPPEEEPGAPAAYGGAGSIDGQIPGRFWMNLRTTDLHSKYSLADLTFHEAIPGHIWQGEYTHEMPLIRQMLGFNAYSEGWALYAEQLADELGAFESDPVGRLGYLQSIAFRACRLVVDTGLHAKRWTREQGVQFFVDVNGSNPLEVASEVDRYCSWPGQACGYKVGHSEINRQRERASTALGPAFVAKAFNDTMVLGGNVPLDVLAKNVDEYIRTAKTA